MAVFFKTPAPPGVAAVRVRDAILVRAEGLFEHRQLRRRPPPLSWLWAKGPDGRLSGGWAGRPSASETADVPLRLVAAR